MRRRATDSDEETYPGRTEGFMNLHSILFWALWLVWIIMEIIVNLRARSLRKKFPATTKADQGSVWFIFGGMYVLILIAFFLAMNGIGLMPTWVPFVGNAVMALGITMRYLAITQLGRYFSSTVQIAPGQTVIHSGWYRKIRHPAYTGGWLIAVGLGLGLDTWVGTIIIAVGLFAIYRRRILIEEQALVSHMGSSYSHYRQHTYHMFPWIW
ncbi:MAG: isoprenylcysteine carboxylmethyltransferase family protein [Sulfobacillus thermotolerans]|nr:isoprenylcysteine carboxylmethyltransferase family protein [Sulfobacillus thermotolerans]